MNVSTHYRSDIMQHRVEFHWILLVLVTMVCAPQAKKQESSYTALRKGQIVRGNIAAEFKAYLENWFQNCFGDSFREFPAEFPTRVATTFPQNFP